MNALPWLLKLSAPIFFVVAAIHLALGAGAEVLLGAELSEQSLRDAALDSQNRFYGVTFTLFGVLFYLSATDLPRYAPALRCALWVFFAAGLARLVSVATHGWPPPLIISLMALEIVLPPLVLLWLRRLGSAWAEPKQAI